jgi:hypothetical protein
MYKDQPTTRMLLTSMTLNFIVGIASVKKLRSDGVATIAY